MAGLAPVTDESSVDPVVRAALSHTEQPPLSPVTAAFERGVVPAFERVAPPAATEVRRGEGLGLRVGWTTLFNQCAPRGSAHSTCALRQTQEESATTRSTITTYMRLAQEMRDRYLEGYVSACTASLVTSTRC